MRELKETTLDVFTLLFCPVHSWLELFVSQTLTGNQTASGV